MIDSVRTLIVALALGAALGSAGAATPETTGSRTRYNVLFIASDDLRPQTGCYGDPAARTPHIDALAARGLLFTRAYCQQAVCSPSRTSLLTGLRPDSTGVYDLETHFRWSHPDVVTLPQLFRENGYFTQAFGKIYHTGLDDPLSWSTTAGSAIDPNPDRHRLRPPVPAAQKATSGTVRKPGSLRGTRGPAWEAPDVADSALPDGQIADQAIDALRHADKEKPFFLAVGFIKPHLPFVAPKKYYDLYPPGSLSPAPNSFPPKGAPRFALTDSAELRTYRDIPSSGPLSESKAREVVRGYYASVSYMDAQVGRVLDELDRLGLREKTIVVFWGDHGWQLGEHGLWCKHTNFEVAARAPLIISVPGRTDRGARSGALVEFVDIYPTLCELAALKPPAGLEGFSFASLLGNPDRPWKKAAFSQYPRGQNMMGYSMRTERYRYTEWTDRQTSEVRAAELYDHLRDPEENENIATTASDPELTPTLSRMLHDGWETALPAGK